MDSIKLTSTRVILSENEENPDVLTAKFIICDFGVNENGVALDRESISEWLNTLVNKPVVGKITVSSDGTADFTGHNAKVVVRLGDDGQPYEDLEFDTSAFGTFVSVGIETIDGLECITATAEIWKRFAKACEVIKERAEAGTLSTSWEIRVIDAEQSVVDSKPCRLIKLGSFLGHCLLGRGYLPAYPSSGVLSVASADEADTELASALTQDILESSVDTQSYRKEIETLPNEKNDAIATEDFEVVTSEEEGEQTAEEPVKENGMSEAEAQSESVPEGEGEAAEDGEPAGEETAEDAPEVSEAGDESNEGESGTETSSLTVNDLRRRIAEACARKLGECWAYVAFFFPADNTVWVEDPAFENELNFIKFTYSVNDDEVTVSDGEPVVLTVSPRQINDRLSQLEGQISELQSANAELEKYRAEHEENEQAAKRAQLSEYVAKSNRFTSEELEDEDSEINKLISELNESAIKALIADRCVADSHVATSTVKPKKVVADISPKEEVTAQQIMQAFLR